MSPITTSIELVLEVLARAIRGEKKSFRLKGKVKLSLFEDYVMLYVDNPKEPTKNYYN